MSALSSCFKKRLAVRNRKCHQPEQPVRERQELWVINSRVSSAPVTRRRRGRKRTNCTVGSGLEKPRGTVNPLPCAFPSPGRDAEAVRVSLFRSPFVRGHVRHGRRGPVPRAAGRRRGALCGEAAEPLCAGWKQLPLAARVLPPGCLSGRHKARAQCPSLRPREEIAGTSRRTAGMICVLKWMSGRALTWVLKKKIFFFFFFFFL